ncbi:MAG: hypothetical protein KGJ13_07780 [Patescibacteria group bacterium]|nr:hypothetical protein [Patescibacteria group bacterium]
MKFDLAKFYRFCSELRVDAKEVGVIPLSNLLGTQKYVMDEIAKGLENDIHYFVTLKGRQLGITTISLALDLYWLFTHSGLQATMVTDTEENKEMFRSTLGMYVEGLPKQWKIPIVPPNNRNLMTLKNRSRFFYQVAGVRSKGTLGRGKAITYLHGTETSSWGDEEGLASLLASLAETNPNRFYHFESTARGFNMFHDMYMTAKKARTQCAIFCGWWRNEAYACPDDSDVFRVYWDGRIAPEEREWTRDIKQLYDFTITPNQLAWWRWKMAEVIQDDALMYQEFPPTEDYAFIMSGSAFFSISRCTDMMRYARDQQAKYYRYVMSDNFHQTEVIETNDKLATLTVWEEPHDSAYYVIGADPAYGSSDWADRFALQVFRCYADGLEQVAEFVTPEMTTYQFAWVIAHLAGAYKNSTLNLEVNGPGQAVINELKNLRRQAASLGGDVGRGLMNVFGSMKQYIWRKNDNLSGISSSIGWLTTASTKERMLAYFKDSFERGNLAIRSTDLLDEMKSIRRQKGDIAAEGRKKDDLVISTALACAAYAEQVQPILLAAKITRKVSEVQETFTPEQIIGQRTVSNYLRKIGIYGAQTR